MGNSSDRWCESGIGGVVGIGADDRARGAYAASSMWIPHNPWIRQRIATRTGLVVLPQRWMAGLTADTVRC